MGLGGCWVHNDHDNNNSYGWDDNNNACRVTHIGRSVSAARPKSRALNGQKNSKELHQLRICFNKENKSTTALGKTQVDKCGSCEVVSVLFNQTQCNWEDLSLANDFIVWRTFTSTVAEWGKGDNENLHRFQAKKSRWFPRRLVLLCLQIGTAIAHSSIVTMEAMACAKPRPEKQQLCERIEPNKSLEDSEMMSFRFEREIFRCQRVRPPAWNSAGK